MIFHYVNLGKNMWPEFPKFIEVNYLKDVEINNLIIVFKLLYYNISPFQKYQMYEKVPCALF